MKGKILRFTLFSLVILSFALPAFPQGPPIITDTAVISGIEGAALRSFLKYTEKSGDLAGGRDGELSVLSVPMVLPYEIFPNKLLFVGKIPYTEKRRKVKDGAATERLSNSGIGDLSLNLKYLFFQKDAPNESTRAVFLGGVKLPTGEDDKKGLPPPLQDGSGSYDYSLGLIISRFRERIGLSADLVYTSTLNLTGLTHGRTKPAARRSLIRGAIPFSSRRGFSSSPGGLFWLRPLSRYPCWKTLTVSSSKQITLFFSGSGGLYFNRTG
jgi:hypothetical protein